MNKEKINIDTFEAISEISENQLVGGFSTSISMNKPMAFMGDDSNNCQGGNCSPGCGSGQNASQCNTTAGCGVPVRF